ncbi:MAG: hypothetical protein VKK04_23580 [Synechococcales bacterium]|nr:hypothetical protein [Synechococcales bacterium]
MNHPFDLDLATLQTLNLEFQDNLSQQEAAQVGGARRYVSRYMGEAGGWRPHPIQPKPKPIEPPFATTMALGEEGGWTFPPEVIIEPTPKPPINPPEVTTMAMGEEGGDWLM